MTFPFPRFSIAQKDRKIDEARGRGDFAEASELAKLRLEQCIADLQIWLPTMNEKRDGHRDPAF